MVQSDLSSAEPERQRIKKRKLLAWPFTRLWSEIVSSYKNVPGVRWLLLGICVGIISGFAAVFFFYAIEMLKHFFLHTLAGLSMPSPAGESMFEEEGGAPGVPRLWIIPILTCAVGILTGWLVKKFIPDSQDGGTDGTDSMIKAFHQRGGVIRPLVPVIKGLTAVLTIATGGSAGREGPITQIGGGIGSWLAMKLHLSARERRIMLLAGAAGGLGAIFRAPMGGALTAIEVIYLEDFETEAVLPAVFSSVSAYTIFTLFFGSASMFGIPEFQFSDVRELPFYILLALVCSVSGWIYVKSFFFIKYKIFKKINDKFGLIVTTGLGGLTMGLLGMCFPYVLTGGYGWLEQAIQGNLTVTLMLSIILVKIVATSVTIGSGMSGGMFAPALFVGGLSGGLVGYVSNFFYPDVVTQPGGYVLVGMAAFFAGVANAPIGPLLMVCELTSGYGLLAPLMLASALCLVLNRKISLYEYQLDNKFDSPAHIADSTINILEGQQVKDFYTPGLVVGVQESTRFHELVNIITESNEFNFPVLDKKGTYTGMLAVNDIRKVLFEDEALKDLFIAKDIARKPMHVRPDYDLYTALMKFMSTDLDMIPVLDADDELIGSLKREDVFKAYSMSIDALDKKE